MRRRDFCGKAGCAIAGLMAAPMAFDLSGQEEAPPAKRPEYKIEIEIYEARKDTWCHKKGDKFKYPEVSRGVQIYEVNRRIFLRIYDKFFPH